MGPSWASASAGRPSAHVRAPVGAFGCYGSSLTHVHSMDSSLSPGFSHTTEHGWLGGGFSQRHSSGGRQIKSHGDAGAFGGDGPSDTSEMTAPNSRRTLISSPDFA